MKPLTINDLKKWCDSAVKEGFGKRTIIVPTDDEGNGYHCVYSGLSLAGNMFMDKYAPYLSGMKTNEAETKAIILS